MYRPPLRYTGAVAKRRVYLPRQHNRPSGLFHSFGRTYGVLETGKVVRVEHLREAYLFYRPAVDDLEPPANIEHPPYNATGGPIEPPDDLPDLLMPDFDELEEPNELLEARERGEDYFTWEDGQLTMKGNTFSAEQVAEICKAWLAADD